MTETLFRADAYTRTCEAYCHGVNDRGGIVLDRTDLLRGGRRPAGRPRRADVGRRRLPHRDHRLRRRQDDDRACARRGLARCRRAGRRFTSRSIGTRATLHAHAHGAAPAVLPGEVPVTGGQIGADDGRLDFDIADRPRVDKDTLTADLNALIAADHPVSDALDHRCRARRQPASRAHHDASSRRWASGKVRLVAIGDDGAVDLQPCGGTHVARTGEIGRLAVTKIEKQGQAEPAHPRRVRLDARKNARNAEEIAMPASPSKWLVETDWLADAPRQRPTSSCSTARCTCRPPAQRHAPSTLAEPHPRRAVLRHRRHRRQDRTRCRTCCPRRCSSPAAGEEDGHRRRHARSSSTTARASIRRRACGGCSAPWAMTTSRCSTAA